MINRRGWVVIACLATFAAGFIHGERQERKRWPTVAWEGKGDRLK